MSISRVLHLWLRISFFWILFAGVMGSKRWSFPDSFLECWKKQKILILEKLGP